MDTASVLRSGRFGIHFLPRVSWNWDQFLENTPEGSIALDGMVRGGPRFDMRTMHVNFDHHDGVLREVTMSTAMQVFFALKGGMIPAFMGDIHLYVNDTDQDTSLALWLLLRHADFEGVKSIPHVGRLLALTDRLDITGGAFPMFLDTDLLRHHGWVFQPYSDLRKSGGLAKADAMQLRDNFEAVSKRLDAFMMGQGKSVELDTRHEIIYKDDHFQIVDEIGGNEARYHLFSLGMKAFVSIVARRPDGRMVCTVGRRSQWVTYFDLPRIYDALNAAEGATLETGWNGSTIIGGSSRANGTKLSIEQIRDVILSTLVP